MKAERGNDPPPREHAAIKPEVIVGHFSLIRSFHLADFFTLANGGCGIAALLLAVRHAEDRLDRHLYVAGLLVVLALVFDVLDGRIARWRGEHSAFGRELDSLADVFTFGVVPALLTYFWGLYEWHRIGWLVPFFYLVCAATRLARFNVQTKVVDSRYFVGLPAPAAAGTVCSILFFSPDSEWREWMQLLMLVALAVIGLLMVSTFRYLSGKKLDLQRRLSFRILVAVAGLLLVVVWHWQATALAVTTVFTVSGPLGAVVSRLRGRRGRPAPLAPTPSGEP